MRLAPFFSLSQRSRCSKAKTNTNVLHSKDKHKGLDHACSLILLQQTTMLAVSSIGFFHQLCGFSILLRLIQHSIIVLQLYHQKQLKNPLTTTDFYKALAPHRLSTLRNCRKVDASDKLGKMFRCGSTWRLELTTFPFFNPATPSNCCHRVSDQRQN